MCNIVEWVTFQFGKHPLLSDININACIQIWMTSSTLH